MHNVTFPIAAVLTGMMSAASANAMAISEVAELQFHKVNQLVATKKIDGGFVDHLASVALAKDPASANYLVTFREEADSGQGAITVVVKADAGGKAQSYQAQAGKLAANLANWGGKAPLDLLEKAVEYVVDTTDNPLTPAFRNGFTGATIEPFLSATGLEAKVKVTAAPGAGTLDLYVDLNGKILSTSKE